MRGASRRRSDAVRISLQSFSWPRAATAVLRHVSLPWNEELAGTPLTGATTLGSRDRLSLTAQYAAHQAFLQFAGIADGVFEPADWIVVRKRGCDCRLVRVAAGVGDVMTAPPPLSLVQDFADAIGARIEPLERSWTRPDVVYGEIVARLLCDITSDLRWMRGAAPITRSSAVRSRLGRAGEGC